jgi:hypothetical protein
VALALITRQRFERAEVSNGLNLNINRLDFNRLKHKCTESTEAEMTTVEWDMAEYEYRRYLSLKSLYLSVAPELRRAHALLCQTCRARRAKFRARNAVITHPRNLSDFQPDRLCL